MPRFDEIELQSLPLGEVPAASQVDVEPEPAAAEALPTAPAPRFRRLLALLTDLSLFAALALALSPLLPPHATLAAWTEEWPSFLSLAGFLVVISYYYFVGSWLLWGKTVGGAIFEVRIVPEEHGAMALMDATRRWAGLMLSLLLAGLGFLLAALPSRRSLADRLSGTRAVTG